MRADPGPRLRDYRALLGERRAAEIAARARQYGATLGGRDQRWLDASLDVLDDPYQSLNFKGAEETLKLDRARALAQNGGVSASTSELDAIEHHMRSYRLHSDTWVERHGERAARIEAIALEREQRKDGRNGDGSFRAPARGGDPTEAFRHPLGQGPLEGRAGGDRAEIWDRAYYLDVQAEQLEQTGYRPGLARFLRVRATSLREKHQLQMEGERGASATDQSVQQQIEPQRDQAGPELDAGAGV